MVDSVQLKNSMKKMLHVLSFRASRGEFGQVHNTDLLLGLLVTWLVGVGRWWDDPKAEWWQHLGLGSLAYIILLTVFLWIILKPLRTSSISLARLCMFVCFTSLPALLYAIPIEKVVNIDTATGVNALFLLVVAVWRVALLSFYLWRFVGLQIWETIVVTLMPLTLIVTGLSILNLERGLVMIMGGFREPHTLNLVNDVILGLAFFSIWGVISLVCLYVVILVRRWLVRTRADGISKGKA